MPDKAYSLGGLIYLVDPDSAQAESLAAQIRYFGYRVEIVKHIDRLVESIDSTMPDAVLIRATFSGDSFDGEDVINHILETHPEGLPVVFLSDSADLRARLKAIRLGGKAYFTRPIDVGYLVDRLDRLCASADTEPFRVLIVDDNEQLAWINAMNLKRAGMQVQVITKPLELFPLLEEFNPDLLLLDIYMPGCTGLELATVIRQMKAFLGLPIVFLSAESDRDKQLGAVSLGGDDFLPKPIKPEHLISAVTSRIERYRQLRALMLRDSLTGLFNHTAVRERLSQEIANAERHHVPLAGAMIDLDHFKQVNDQFGHACGDRVLKALSHMLTHRLRRSDIVGRYGGEEFLVILPNTSGEGAYTLLDELRASFAQISHICGEQEFRATFSCGVAAFMKHDTLASLSESADRALYHAKQGGRNCVKLANRSSQ
ncbi:MAG: response regulator, partial [Chloroflexota bacterium]